MTAERPSRRTFLALAATSATAGCNALPDSFTGEEKSPKLDASALEEMAGRDVPSVSPPTTVTVEQSYFEAAVSRANERLETVPAPLGPDDVPNEAFRRRLTEVYERAADELEALSGAEPSAAALPSVRRARENAQYAATTWEAITTDLTHRDVAKRIPDVRSDLVAFRNRWQYLGDDPIPALLVHDSLESLVRSADEQARRNANREYRNSDSSLAVGELAGALEEARAAVEDANYLYDRFEASLDSSRNLRSVFEQTSESLSETLVKRRSRLPTTSENGDASFVDRDISGTVAESALEELFRDVNYSNVEDLQTEGQYAHSILEAHSELARSRAFQSLRTRVSDGEEFAIESASDIESLRTDAVEAIADAPAATRYGNLAREEVSTLAEIVGYTDERFTDLDDPTRAEWVVRDAARYLTTAEVARAVPSVSDDVGDTLGET